MPDTPHMQLSLERFERSEQLQRLARLDTTAAKLRRPETVRASQGRAAGS